MPGLSALATRPSRRRYRRRTISLTAFQGRQRRARRLHVLLHLVTAVRPSWAQS